MGALAGGSPDRHRTAQHSFAAAAKRLQTSQSPRAEEWLKSRQLHTAAFSADFKQGEQDLNTLRAGEKL